MISESERKVLEIVREKGLVRKVELGQSISVANSLKDKGYLRKVVLGEDAFVITIRGSMVLNSKE
ncbi:MAG: hypothetical protein ACE5J7_04415 [Candidatus Aenigmatarchaeota archaeon]